MRLHLGKPHEPMIITRNCPTFIGERRLDVPSLFVRWMFGLSWATKAKDGFIFVGIKRFDKWNKNGESK